MSRQTRRKNAKNGGGWAQGPPLSPNSYYLTEYKSYGDCYDQARPGQIQSNPNPALAQTAMAGGNKRSSRRAQRGGVCPMQRGGQCPMQRGGVCPMQRGGCGCGLKMAGGACPYMRGGACPYMRGGACPYMRGGACPYMRGGACPYMRGGSRNSKKGGCGCGLKSGGGKKKTRNSRVKKAKRTMRGGRYGFDVSQSIGGDGPIVAATVAHVPCEGHHPTPLNPTVPSMLGNPPSPDVSVAGLRPAFIQGGGGMPGGGHPLAYTAPTASYSFIPNIAQGQVINPGQIPYNEVVGAPLDGACISDCASAIKAISA